MTVAARNETPRRHPRCFGIKRIETRNNECIPRGDSVCLRQASALRVRRAGRRLMKTSPIRAGAHIEGIHWIAEYAENVHEIRIFREGLEVDVHNAPSTLFGDEENAGSKSCADHRAAEAAVIAYLRRFVAEHDAEE
jgi:hypothetical protein